MVVMRGARLPLLLAAAQLLLGGTRAQDGCALANGRCVCGGFDLTGVDTVYSLRGPGTTWGDWLYTVSLCDQLIVPDTCAYWGITNTIAFRLEDYQFTPQCENLATQPNTVVVTPTADGVSLSLAPPYPALTINYVCSTTTDAMPSAPTTGGDMPVITWNAAAACDGPAGGGGGGGSDGLSFGSAFSIAFFSAGALYAAGGCFIARRKPEKPEGMAALPNAEFWTDTLPGLVKDGWHFARAQLSAKVGFLAFLKPDPYAALPTDEEAGLDAAAGGAKGHDKRGKKDKDHKRSSKKDKGGGKSDKDAKKDDKDKKSKKDRKDKDRSKSKSKSKSKSAPKEPSASTARLALAAKPEPYRATPTAALSSGARETGVKAVGSDSAKSYHYDASGTKRENSTGAFL